MHFKGLFHLLLTRFRLSMSESRMGGAGAESGWAGAAAASLLALPRSSPGKMAAREEPGRDQARPGSVAGGVVPPHPASPPSPPSAPPTT